MSYKFSIPEKSLSDLWRLREYAAMGPIAKQVRDAVSQYIQVQTKKIGCPIPDIEEAIERENYEQSNDKT